MPRASCSFRSNLHRADAYRAISIVVPLMALALVRVSRHRWAATIVASTYVGFMAAMVWLFPLFAGAYLPRFRVFGFAGFFAFATFFGFAFFFGFAALAGFARGVVTFASSASRSLQTFTWGFEAESS